MKDYEKYTFESYVSRMNNREFDDFLFSLQRYEGYNIITTIGIDALTEPQARELHRFLFEHGAPVKRPGFENIDRNELIYICKAINERSLHQ